MKDQGAVKEQFQADEPGHYYLNTSKLHKKRPVLFGAVRIGKSYVSYHLMPVYGCPDLIEGLSKRRQARMQGKACFKLKTVEPALIEELTRRTHRRHVLVASRQLLRTA